MPDFSPHIEQVPLASLVPYPNNPKLHPDGQIDLVAGSIREFGFLVPLVIDAKGSIIAGHGRYQAAKKLGLETVPAIRAEHLTTAQIKAYRLADNKLAEGEWDETALDIELEGLKVLGFDLAITGFDEPEPEEPIQAPEPQIDKADELQEKWKVERGQVWEIGEHRLMCGDGADDSALLLSHGVDAVITDPPYGIGFEYASHDDSRSEWFLLMDRMIPPLRGLANFVVMPCCGIDRMGWWYEHHAPDWLIAWYKGSPGHRSAIGFNDWEVHLVWGKPPGPMHDYFQTACGFFDGPGHPCPKPVAWALWLCERSAPEGGTIYDPFLGSGTTMVAAEQLGRRCYGMEIEPKYCAVVLERMSDMGLTPRLAK